MHNFFDIEKFKWNSELDKSLRDHLVEVLTKDYEEGNTIGLGTEELEKRVRANGYRYTTGNLRNAVSHRLWKFGDLFYATSRGVWRIRTPKDGPGKRKRTAS